MTKQDTHGLTDTQVAEAEAEAEAIVGQILIQANQLMDGMLDDRFDMAQRVHVMGRAGVALIVNAIGNTASNMKAQGRDDETVASATAGLTAMLMEDTIKYSGGVVTAICEGEEDQVGVMVRDGEGYDKASDLIREGVNKLREKAGLEPEVTH